MEAALTGDMTMAKERLLAAAGGDYSLQLLKELIRTPSETPPGDVREIIALAEREMRKIGFDTRILAKVPEKPNLIATLSGDGSGPTVVLYSHADCASIGEENRVFWTVDPLGAEIRDGKIYGNGAADAKSAMAALMGACKAIVDARIPLKGKLIFMATADGEVGDFEGAKWLHENGLIPKADYGVNGDASDLNIQHVWRGRAFFTITVEGKVAHSNTPHLGINAISKMAKVVQALDNFKLTYTPHPIVPDSSMTVTMISGGTKHNSLPGFCRATLDVRTVPGQTIRGAQEEIQALFSRMMAEDPDLKVSIELMEFGARETLAFPSDIRIVREFDQAFREVTGEEPRHRAGHGSAGCISYFAEEGIPSIFFGPANLLTAHQPDEHCPIDNLVIATKVAALAVARIVGEV